MGFDPLGNIFEAIKNEGIKLSINGTIVRLESGHEIFPGMTTKQVVEMAARLKKVLPNHVCIPVKEVRGEFTEIRKEIAMLNTKYGLPGTGALLNQITVTLRERSTELVGACE